MQQHDILSREFGSSGTDGQELTRAAVIGLGYVGLTTAACLASRGIQTIGIEVDRSKLELLESGDQELFEPKLNEILESAQGPATQTLFIY